MKIVSKLFLESPECLKIALNSIGDALIVTNLEGKVVFLNSVAIELSGYNTSEYIGQSINQVFKIVNIETREEVDITADWFNDFISVTEHTILISSDGTEHITSNMITPIKRSSGEIFAVIMVFRDITSRKQAEEALRYQSYHDSLTNLPNRTLFTDRLNMALTYAQQNNAKLAVLFMDMDNFNYINDILGHTVGDQLILGISERLISTLSNEVTVGRFSGDKFSILLPKIAEVEEAAKVAHKILDELRKPWIIDGQEFYITASIGIAIYPNDGEDAQLLLKNADLAMSRAKERKDSYQLYTPMMNVEAMERLALERELRKALDKNEFLLYYQPQIDVKDKRIIGMEALVRWNHPRRGLVSPMQFIPLAEATGLIIPLGEWVLYTACSQNKAWQKAGFPPLRVSVNLSGSQFKQKNILDMVAKVLKATGLESKWLQLEITESVAMEDVEYTVKTLRVLKNMGIQLAIDDFGTGYSSLSYLKRFPISTLKIDRSFINDINDKNDDAAILSSIIFLAHNLNLNVIAEGVETMEQLDFLKERRCHEIQGYLFSRPVPADQFIKLVSQNNG